MKPPCENCHGACCQQGAHGMGGVGPGPLLFTPRCQYLMRDNRCSIYDARPQGCREFDCTTNEHFQRAMGAGPWSEAIKKGTQ